MVFIAQERQQLVRRRVQGRRQLGRRIGRILDLPRRGVDVVDGEIAGQQVAVGIADGPPPRRHLLVERLLRVQFLA